MQISDLAAQLVSVGKGPEDPVRHSMYEKSSKWAKKLLSHFARFLSAAAAAGVAHNVVGEVAGGNVVWALPAHLRKTGSLSHTTQLVQFWSPLCLPYSQRSPLCHCCLPPSEALLFQCGFSLGLSSYSELFCAWLPNHRRTSC